MHENQFLNALSLCWPLYKNQLNASEKNDQYQVFALLFQVFNFNILRLALQKQNIDFSFAKYQTGITLKLLSHLNPLGMGKTVKILRRMCLKIPKILFMKINLIVIVKR